MAFLRNGGGFCLSKFYVFLYITMAYGIGITYGLPIEEEALQEDENITPVYTLSQLHPMKRSLALGRNSFRPGKRSTHEDYAIDDNLMYVPVSKRSLALGRNSFRPGKRNLDRFDPEYDTFHDLPYIREDQMGKRSLTLGRHHYRPGKRSMAISRAGFRPGKRSLHLDLQAPVKRSVSTVSNSYFPENLQSFETSQTYENLGRMVNDMANRHKFVVIQQVRTTTLAQPTENS